MNLYKYHNSNEVRLCDVLPGQVFAVTMDLCSENPKIFMALEGGKHTIIVKNEHTTLKVGDICNSRVDCSSVTVFPDAAIILQPQG